MFNHRLQCRVVPQEDLHPGIFRLSSRLGRTADIARIQHNKVSGVSDPLHMRSLSSSDCYCSFDHPLNLQPRTEEQCSKIIKRSIRKEKKLRKQLEEAGIEYDFVGLVCTHTRSLSLSLSLSLSR
jgi:hypothetical protein